MKTIRNNVFETNSSSSHSLCIIEGDLNDMIYPDEEGRIHLVGGEFGWGYEEHNDSLTKANYCAVAFLEHESYLEMLKEVIIEHTKCEEVIILAELFNYNSPYNSYIDHQSIDEAADSIYSKQDLKNFIFNPNSKLIIDNDNH
jgi:hypothetical protein